MDNYKQLKDKQEIIIFKDDTFSNGWEKLPAGIYNAFYSGSLFSAKLTFSPTRKIDSLLRFKSGIVSDIIEKTCEFYSEKTSLVYKELRVCHKMGIILHGPPGTGKTCTARLIMEEIVKIKDAICIIGTGQTLSFILTAVSAIRQIQNNPIIVFMDEVDSQIKIEENNFLTFLDGDLSVDGLLFIGCTNYIDRVPKRIRDRKSRIKHLYEVKALPQDVYKEYITDRLPKMEGKVIAEFSYKSEDQGLTLDQVKNALIDYRINDLSIDEAIKGVKI